MAGIGTVGTNPTQGTSLVAILGYLLTAGKATVAECEDELKMN